MPDDLHARFDPGDALRDLPLLSPPRSAWPAIKEELDREVSGTRSRWPRWLALAAVVAGAALMPVWLQREATPDAVPVARDATPELRAEYGEDAALTQLMHESERLEALIAWSRPAAVESAPSATLAAVIKGRIGHLDGLLSRAELDPDARLPLWQERVLRLRQLANLHGTEQMLAASGDSGLDVPLRAF